MSEVESSEWLCLDRVSYRFGEHSKHILENISLEVAPRESIGILGPSGSGKTTLLKLIAGLLQPTEGQILFQGSPVQRKHEWEKKEFAKALGMSFQRGGLLDCFNVKENVDFALSELTRLKKQQRSEIVDSVLGRVGLQEVSDFPLRNLSGGMLKRLSIARAIVLEPKLLLLDEPTAGLDPITSAEIVELIRTYLDDTGATVIFVTSDLSVAFLLGKRLGLLSDGRFLHVSDVNQFRMSPQKEVRYFLRGTE